MNITYEYFLKSNMHASIEVLKKDAPKKWKDYIALFCDYYPTITFIDSQDEMSVYVDVQPNYISLLECTHKGYYSTETELRINNDSTTCIRTYYTTENSTKVISTNVIFKDTFSKASVKKCDKIIDKYYNGYSD